MLRAQVRGWRRVRRPARPPRRWVLRMSDSWSYSNVGPLGGRKLFCATCRDTRLPVAFKVQRKSRRASWRIRIRSEEGTLRYADAKPPATQCLW